MSASEEFPQVEVSVVLLERARMLLVEFNPKWEAFTLSMARVRRLAVGGAVREKPLETAVRAATKALGWPLPAAGFPRPITLEVPPQTLLRSGRDQQPGQS